MQRPYLICTDLDRTLIPNGEAQESPSAAARFERLVDRPDVLLAYVSGRHLDLVEQAIDDFSLPSPDFIIGDVGTTMYRAAGGWQPVTEWQSLIAQDWSGLVGTELLDWLGGVAGLQPQESEKQNRFKASFYYPSDFDMDSLAQVITGRLEQCGVRARLVWSHDDLVGDGLLDVLPYRASKFGAIEALLGMEALDEDRTVFCGDSGNDLEVLVSKIRAVLVANAKKAVRDQALEGAREAGFPDRLYLAQGDFLGMNGNYRGGMLEGISHYFPQLAPGMNGELAP